LDSRIQNKVKKILILMAGDLKNSFLKIKKMRGLEAWGKSRGFELIMGC